MQFVNNCSGTEWFFMRKISIQIKKEKVHLSQVEMVTPASADDLWSKP